MKWISAKIKPPVEYRYTDTSEVETTGNVYDSYMSDDCLVLLSNDNVAFSNYYEFYWRDVRTPDGKTELREYGWNEEFSGKVVAYMPISDLPEFNEEED